MPWQPITEESLLTLLAEELAQLPADLREQYESADQPPCRVPCERGLGTEAVFLVFRSDDRFVIYDDVEEEFAVAMADNVRDGVVTAWVPAGSLEWAMKAAVFS